MATLQAPPRQFFAGRDDRDLQNLNAPRSLAGKRADRLVRPSPLLPPRHCLQADARSSAATPKKLWLQAGGH